MPAPSAAPHAPRPIQTPSDVLGAVAPLAPRCADLVRLIRQGVPREDGYWRGMEDARTLHSTLDRESAEAWAIAALLLVDGSSPALSAACECAKRAIRAHQKDNDHAP